LSLGEATGAVEALGLQVNTTERLSDEPFGTVVSQAPSAGESVAPASLVTLFIASGPLPSPSPKDAGLMVAQEVAGSVSNPVSYAELRDNDGYVVECPSDPCHQNGQQVAFDKALAIAVDGESGPLWTTMKRAVLDNMLDLQLEGYRYVLIGFPGKPHTETIVMGFKLSDWPKFGTFRQPSNPLLGLITDKDVNFEPV
jgi:PASTA domain